MQRDIHPHYQHVMFRDRSTGDMFLTRSTATSQESVEFAGTTYPVISTDITSYSHPVWTGTAREIDAEGRVQRFRRRYGK